MLAYFLPMNVLTIWSLFNNQRKPKQIGTTVKELNLNLNLRRIISIKQS